MKIGVIGCGYVGLVTGACFASLGHQVTILDQDKKKISKLKKGRAPFFEPGIEEMINKSMNQKNLIFTSSFKKLADSSKVYFICVGTPQHDDGEPNLSYINSVKDQLVDYFIRLDDSDERIVFIKSTVPPGSTKKFQEFLYSKNLRNKFVASNPEFLREGSAVFDFFHPDRVVIGTTRSEVKDVARMIYTKVVSKNKIYYTDPQSSEIIKYASNAFLATKISFINEIARLSDKVGADIKAISKGIGLDKRINKHFLNAGIGYGGSCFPKDTFALKYAFSRNTLDSHLIDSVIRVNKDQKNYFLDKILSQYATESLRNLEVLLWGTAFKPNTDDIRESVGIKIAYKLAPLVKQLNIFEPIAKKNSILELKHLKNVKFVDSPFDNIQRNSFLVICSENNCFSEVNYEHFLKLKDQMIFDGRNILSKSMLKKLGITYFGVGY